MVCMSLLTSLVFVFRLARSPIPVRTPSSHPGTARDGLVSCKRLVVAGTRSIPAPVRLSPDPEVRIARMPVAVIDVTPLRAPFVILFVRALV